MLGSHSATSCFFASLLATGLPGTKIFFFVVEPLEVRHGFLTQYLDHHYYTHFVYLYLETTGLLTQLS
jgi:hypothetical protein